mgnify:CR=1 FL=1
MKRKKIRGHKRRWRAIDRQVDTLKIPDMLSRMGKAYADLSVVFRKSHEYIQEPEGKTRMKILNGLLDIYESWKAQLDKTGQSYYLKIWLFEPRFSMSRVVCALGEQMDFYENMFPKPVERRIINPDHYGCLKQRMELFDWEAGTDEDHFSDNEPGLSGSYVSRKNYEKVKKRFEQLLKKPHRISRLSDPQGADTSIYSFVRGTVWIGELRRTDY